MTKIDTIGDAYMAACGMDESTSGDHAIRMLGFAEALIAAIAENRLLAPNGVQLRVRVGIHTGPVVSAAPGRLQRRISLFGDSVRIPVTCNYFTRSNFSL